MKSLGEEALKRIGKNGFTVSDFPYKNASFAGYFIKISGLHPSMNDYIPGMRVMDALEGKDSIWYNKNSPEGLQKMQDVLMPVMQEICRHHSLHFAICYGTCRKETIASNGTPGRCDYYHAKDPEENNTLDIGDSTYLLKQADRGREYAFHL